MNGKVFFVGGGPGALDLLTVRAVRTLQEADVILHDELVPKDFRELLSPSAVVINVGKRCGQLGSTQDRINRFMVEYARRGCKVVRLKSGDPSIFGRLGEEIHALRSAGIDFDIVPGVTAAVAAAASVRVPLTERGVASRVTLATASMANEQRPDWHECIRDGSTLVIYMPGRDFQRLSRQLLDAGAAPDLPCAVIARCGAVDEMKHLITVSQLGRIHVLPTPAMIIVGEVVRPIDRPQLSLCPACSLFAPSCP
jgi:uroporphyrin-III C-methyltransferase